MKNIVLVHGYNGVPKIFVWLKQELEKRNYKVNCLEFPASTGVIYKDWYGIMEKLNVQFNQDTIVIAHSIGNEFIMKYLSKNDININLFISLAGFLDVFEVEGKDDLNRATKEFLITKEELSKFIELARIKYSIYSDNDHIVPFESLEKFARKIGAKQVLIKGIGHMGKKSGLEQIPEVLEIIENEV